MNFLGFVEALLIVISTFDAWVFEWVFSGTNYIFIRDIKKYIIFYAFDVITNVLKRLRKGLFW